MFFLHVFLVFLLFFGGVFVLLFFFLFVFRALVARNFRFFFRHRHEKKRAEKPGIPALKVPARMCFGMWPSCRARALLPRVFPHLSPALSHHAPRPQTPQRQQPQLQTARQTCPLLARGRRCAPWRRWWRRRRPSRRGRRQRGAVNRGDSRFGSSASSSAGGRVRRPVGRRIVARRR